MRARVAVDTIDGMSDSTAPPVATTEPAAALTFHAGVWWYWTGTQWVPHAPPQAPQGPSTTGPVFAWIGWAVILMFFWPFLLFAWIVPLAFRSAAEKGSFGYRCADEALNTYLSGFVGLAVAGAFSGVMAAAADQVPQNSTGAGVAAAIVWLLIGPWVMSLFLASIVGAVQAGSRQVWHCAWALPITKLHRAR